MGILYNKRITQDVEEQIEENVKEIFIKRHLEEFLTEDIDKAIIDLSVQAHLGTDVKDHLIYPRHIAKVVRYYNIPCLKPFFNRSIEQIDIPTAIKRIRLDNDIQVFIKSTIPKLFAYKVTSENRQEVLETLYNFCMYYESDPVILWQDLVDMQHEIRFMVFNGKVLSCSAQVDEYTPMNNLEQRRWFLPTHKHRGHPEEIEHGISAEYFFGMLGKVALIVDRLTHNDILDYSLDMCLIDGKPSLVEINPLCNSGLFGNDYERFVLAIKQFYLNIKS